MQKVRNASRKRDQQSVLPVVNDAYIPKFNNNILFLLSLRDKRIRKIIEEDNIKITNINYNSLNYTGGNSILSTGIWNKENLVLMNLSKSTFNAHGLIYDSRFTFDYDLRFYTNLNTLHIRNSKRVYLSSFNKQTLDCLILDTVNTIYTDYTENIKINSLKLKNIKISFKLFLEVISICRPKNITLIDIELEECSKFDLKIFRNTLKSLELNSFYTKNSFIDKITFDLIIKDTVYYAYIDSNVVSVFMNNGTIVMIPEDVKCSSYKHQNNFDNIPVSYFNIVEALYITNQIQVKLLSNNMPRLKYLALKNIYIDGQIIDNIRDSVKFIKIENCTFKNTCFYTFINRVGKNLRYIGCSTTEMPLDSISYIKRHVSKCQVLISATIFFYVK